MYEDRFRLLVREGLDPLVDDVPAPPDWEVLLVTPTTKSSRQVPGWQVGLAAAAVITGLIGVTLLVPGREQPAAFPTSSPTESIDPSTTIASSDVQAGPAVTGVTEFEVDVPIPLTIFAMDNRNLTAIDLESGQSLAYEGFATDGVAGAVADSQGRLITWTYEPTLRVFSPDLTQVTMEKGPTDLLFDQGRVIPTVEGDELWVVSIGHPDGDEQAPTVVSRYSVPEGDLLGQYELEGRVFPVAATARGLLFNKEVLVETADGWTTEPGSDEVIHLGFDGEITELGPGMATAAGDSLAIIDCPHERTDGNCYINAVTGEPQNALYRLDIDTATRDSIDRPVTGTWFDVDGPIIPSDSMPLSSVSADGDRLLAGLAPRFDIHGMPQEATLLEVDLVDGTSRTLQEPFGNLMATWSRDGKWVVTFEIEDEGPIDVTVINAAEPDVTFTYENLIPSGQYPLATG